MYKLTSFLEFLILFILFLFIACANRERINPIDPNNPDTRGQPTGIKVISIQDTVFLSWNAINLNDLTGYHIYRKSSSETDFSPLALVPSTVNTFKDTAVVFGVEYSYQLSAVGPTYESLRSDAVAITPGPTFAWVANTFAQQIVKLTHDAQHEIFRTSGFLSPVDIEPNLESGIIWVVDLVQSFLGQVVKLSPDGKRIGTIIQLTSPVDAALEYRTGALWVADNRDDFIAKLDSTGITLFKIKGDSQNDFQFSDPISVSIDQRSGDCWVADGQLNRIAKIKSNGSRIMVSPVNFIALQSLVVNSSNGDIWVADSSRVVRIDENGDFSLELNDSFNHAFKIAVNEITGEVWVLNLIFQFNKSTVSKYNPEGQKIFEIDGFTLPADLSINLFDNSCLIADTQNDRIVRVSNEGKIIGIFDQVINPEAVSVQNEHIQKIYF